MSGVLEELGLWTTGVVEAFGYPGIALLIAVQNLFPPIPSALILPFAGYLVEQGRLSFPLVLLAATSGSLSSAAVFYAVGRRFGERRVRGFVRRFGRFAFVDEGDLDRALRWFGRYGGAAVLFGRLVPGVGTFVSVPAGLGEMPVARFVLYTAVGTSLWNGTFVALGWALGARWQEVQRYQNVYEYLMLAAIAGLILLFVWRRFRGSGREE